MEDSSKATPKDHEKLLYTVDFTIGVLVYPLNHSVYM